MDKEKFNALLEAAYNKGYEDAEIDSFLNESVYTEGFLSDLKDDVKTWYKRRLSSDEIELARKEFKSIMHKFKLPKDMEFKYNFIIKKGAYKMSPLKVKQNKFNILDKNSIANFRIIYYSDKVSWNMADIIRNLVKTLNSNSKNFRWVCHRTVHSTNGMGYTGEIFAYRKTDDIDKDMPFDKGDRINTLINTTHIPVYM